MILMNQLAKLMTLYSAPAQEERSRQRKEEEVEYDN